MLAAAYTRGGGRSEKRIFSAFLLLFGIHGKQHKQAEEETANNLSFLSPPSSSFDHCLPPIPKLSPEERKVCDTGEGEGGGFLELEFRQEGGRAAECSSICL